ncbi:hypothetical protein QRX60_44210 [Amycolatopsis mongoliensis]|uniref:Uncharacterized protein n=1 Tax=Amycolatopsis mongoliensis TaxID=715475 RepID=A0A9Y2JP12_9PSEU|nr:hypothetical protein [Amycolatopsis sp. 4-36]WIY00981.1 hypothetical protein QRX60_44210 [Amycolatopsis sp. 4-36]
MQVDLSRTGTVALADLLELPATRPADDPTGAEDILNTTAKHLAVAAEAQPVQAVLGHRRAHLGQVHHLPATPGSAWRPSPAMPSSTGRSVGGAHSIQLSPALPDDRDLS